MKNIDQILTANNTKVLNGALKSLIDKCDDEKLSTYLTLSFLIPAINYAKDINGVYLFGNQAALDITNIKTLDEFTGKTDEDIIRMNDWLQSTLDTIRKNDNKVIASKKKHTFVATLIPEGTELEPLKQLVSVAPFLNKEGDVIFIVGTAINLDSKVLL